jgi:SAM-dependent methyltransferase
MSKIKSKIVSLIYDYLYIPVLFNLVYIRDLRSIRSVYGNFEKLSRADQKKYTLSYSNEHKNVSGVLVGEIVKMILDLNLNPDRILLDGDDKSVVDQFRKRFGFDKANIQTTGKQGNFDFEWDFEANCPENMPKNFDLIVSQAMFEHLVDPYKHFKDLLNLLEQGGHLVIHTHIPGYTYHRYPVDTIRFFPDWFELSAKRNGLAVKRKFLRNFHIIYLFEKL